MDSSEMYCLKWNDFESRVANSFEIMRNAKDFCNVTLACEDDQQIEAHKVILSACSPFFKHILKKNPHSHPLLYLSGISSADLKLILNFIYQGQVEVKQENLNRFLEVAEKLKLEGLTTKCADTNFSKSDFNEDPKNSSKETKSEIDPSPLKTSDYFLNDECSPTKGDARILEMEIIGYDDGILDNNDTFESTAALLNASEIDKRIAELTIKSLGCFTCKVCGKTATKSTNIANHIETHLGGVSYSCQFCGENYRSRNSLNKHKSVYHK